MPCNANITCTLDFIHLYIIITCNYMTLHITSIILKHVMYFKATQLHLASPQAWYIIYIYIYIGRVLFITSFKSCKTSYNQIKLHMYLNLGYYGLQKISDTFTKSWKLFRQYTLPQTCYILNELLCFINWKQSDSELSFSYLNRAYNVFTNQLHFETIP